MEEKQIPTLSTKDFSIYITETFDADIGESFLNNKISGSLFLKLSESQIVRMVPALGDVIELQSLQSRVQDSLQVNSLLILMFVCMYVVLYRVHNIAVQWSLPLYIL